MRKLKTLMLWTLGLSVLFGLLGVGAVLGGLYHFGRGLPDYRQLADYEPPVMSRVHAGDGTLIAEFARERRLFVPIAAIPRQVVQAFLSAEDKTFYEHPGIDIWGIASALLRNIQSMGSGKRPVGASTITQQVAKNFLLTNEVSLARKVKEAILAFRIEHAFTKDRILELYLNEIYLGWKSYGVAAAALNYFDKSLDELSLAEAAYLAALPKAPNNYHPIRKREAARARRNWVLNQMRENGVIDDAAMQRAQAAALLVRPRSRTRTIEAAYFAEEVRRQLVERFGEAGLYDAGLSVRTTLEPHLQEAAARTLRAGLETYDRRHGWRGPIDRVDLAGDWRAGLRAIQPPTLPAGARLAVVLALEEQAARIGFADDSRGAVRLADVTWARAWRKGQTLGPRVRSLADVLQPGDVIAVRPREADAKDRRDDGYALAQPPEIDGALIAMDPHTGRVLAMVGGFAFSDSQFNRATQAARQPGSSFKPFVYAAALDNGFTPASLILDAPFVIDLGEQGKWKPSNYKKEFYGPSTLRLGIEKSRNLMTVRLANEIGMAAVIDYARRFGVVDDMEPYLPMALGAGETTLLRMTTAYAMFVNGGKRITPSLIDRIQDRRGRTVFRHDGRDCPNCRARGWSGQRIPQVPDIRDSVVDPVTAYQLVSLLRGVVRRGTGVRINALGKPLAGKTGTTNDSRDAWFIGFAPDLAVGVYVGFDTPRSLGRRESASTVAVPIFRDFMALALADQPGIPFRIPPGVRLVRIDARTGIPARPGDRKVILEAFREGTTPRAAGRVLDGSGGTLGASAGGTDSDSGLY